MLLSWFLVLFAISFLLAVVGIYRPEHSELALIGFFFIFLLSFSLINSDIQYRIGTNTTTTFSYSGGNLTATNEIALDNYANFSDINQHNYGYWLAIASAGSFIIILIGLRRSKQPE